MRAILLGAIFVLLGGGLLLPFNSCAPQSKDGQVFEQISQASSCKDCESSGNKKHLSLTVNSNSNVTVLPCQEQVVLGGKCNEAGFSGNLIFWKIYDGDTVVLSSDKNNTHGRCQNGRFSVRINNPILVDSNDGLGQNYDLSLEIKGYDQSGQKYTNPVLGRQYVTLQPTDDTCN